MPTLSATAAREALAGMTQMLSADGYELNVAAENDRLSLVITAGPDACADCLVPKSVFSGIVIAELERNGIAVPEPQVSITYPSEVAG